MSPVFFAAVIVAGIVLSQPNLSLVNAKNSNNAYLDVGKIGQRCLVLRFPYAKERLRSANLFVHGILWRLEPGAITINRLAKEKAAGIDHSDLRHIVVAHTGLEPVISALRGQRVNQLHQCAAIGLGL